MFRKLIATPSLWITLPLRLALGIIFIAHGAQKVFGAFGGKGLQTFISANSPPFVFMRPAWFWMGAAAFSELIGGVLILVGFLTRIGAFLIACVMLTAIFGVHWRGGFFAPAGIEYPFALFFVAFALLIAGGGQASIDRALSDARSSRRR